MTAYWLTFTDGTAACCEGPSPYEAVKIAEKVTGKTVAGDPEARGFGGYSVEPLPYPAGPLIWQFDHPLHGKTPAFCYRPEQCKGRSSCPQDPGVQRMTDADRDALARLMSEAADPHYRMGDDPISDMTARRVAEAIIAAGWTPPAVVADPRHGDAHMTEDQRSRLAFPQPEGLTLRQWYKGQIAAGLAANLDQLDVIERRAAVNLPEGIRSRPDDSETLAKACGQIADALIAEDEEQAQR